MTTTTELKRLFAWLTRTGMGRRFPGMPIGWYQCHQFHAINVLDETFGAEARLRVVHGVVRAKGQKTRIATCEVFKLADERTRR